MSVVPLCDACGKRCEVYGSSWCASCGQYLPEYAKRRIIQLRNTLLTIAHGRFPGITKIRQAAKAALGWQQ